MKFFSAISLLVVALVAVSAAPTEVVDPSAFAAAEEAMIADFYFKDCIPGTNQTIHLENGAIEYTCRKKANRNNSSSKHTFGTNLFVTTSTGGIEVSIGGNGGGFTSTAHSFRFSGYVDSAWGTSRAVAYPAKSSIDAVVNLGQQCTSDGVFCFDVWDHVCIFGFANSVWERSCPLLMVIKFSVAA
ncbi:hypothetical protein BGW42_002481 [Actinomortierella wolfii]|nr:hypothetical protein BGW42_002481 [Actinomortierella wolfii]